MRSAVLLLLIVLFVVPGFVFGTQKSVVKQKTQKLEFVLQPNEQLDTPVENSRGLLSAPTQTNSILIDSARNGYGFSSSGPKGVDWTIDLFGNEWVGVAYRKFVPGDPNTGIIGVAELDATAGFNYSNITFWDYINNVTGTTIGGRYPSFVAAPEGPLPMWTQYDVAGTPTQARAMLSFDFFGWGPFGGGFIPPVDWAKDSNPAIIHSLWLGNTDLYKDASNVYHIGGVWEIDLNSGNYTFIHGTSTDLQSWTFENASLDWSTIDIPSMNVPRFAWGTNGFGAWVSTGYLSSSPDQDYKLMLCTTNDYGAHWGQVQRFDFSELGIPETITAADSIYIVDPTTGEIVLYTGDASVGITYDFDLIVLPNNELHVGCTISWGPPASATEYFPNKLHMGLYDVKSADQGTTWSSSRIWWPSGLLIGDTLGSWVTTNEIDLGHDTNGNLYAAWRDRDPTVVVPTPYPHTNANITNHYVNDIWASMSKDDGATWSKRPFRVTNDQQNSSYGFRLSTRTNWYPNDNGKIYMVYQIADLSRPLPPPVERMDDHVQWYYLAEAKGFLPPYHSTFDENILSDWNLIGMPLDVTDERPQTIFPNSIAGTLFGWSGSYNQRTKIELGEGYWLRFPAAETVQIDGLPVMGFTLNMLADWNMIAGPSEDIALSDIDDPAGIIVPGTLFGFNGAYFTADTVKAGQGYWLRTTAAGQISFNGHSYPSRSLAKKFEPVLDVNTLATLKISDAAGVSQSLYYDVKLANAKDKIRYSLPPLPPKGAFDVRFADNYRVSDRAEDMILVQASRYPLSISVRNLPAAAYSITEMMGSREGRSYRLEEGGEIHISNPQVTALKLTRLENTVASDFALQQNYPNPFNPITGIRYSIPRDAKVELSIYNALGQKVKTLVSGIQPAGAHKVVWDGTNQAGVKVASGVYYYRITSGDFHAIRKMMLLK
ncbi:MAG TPA: T9SS type A sorting domain-containing protein [Caldithrix sp.]|nr:T9SS type A sorting domain-containing protein [Caldithrix sp.]